MPKGRRRSKKKLKGEGRLKDARRWLQSRDRPRRPLVESYSKRYGVTESVAWDELMSLGYYDDILIEQYERGGIEWEYRVEPRSGDMFVVPKGTEEHEIYGLHGII
jgi:hypothetical protein